MDRGAFQKKYLPEFVYGGIDGAVTTFAVVSGAIGASLDAAVILILGFANLFADGFSMAVGNYLSTRSEQSLKTARENTHAKDPKKTALMTYISFILIGFIPLATFVVAPFVPIVAAHKYTLAIILTGAAFIFIGAVRGIIAQESRIKTAVETFSVGSVAALIAYAIGYFIEHVVLQ